MSSHPTDEPALSFADLLSVYAANPNALLSLPQDLEEQNKLFDDAKLAIVDARYQNELELADQSLALAWTMARQTETPEHTALAHWCEGIYEHHRDMRKSLEHFQKALNYYERTQDLYSQGRIQIGYSGALSLLGRLDEAQEAIEKAIELLKDYPNYRDWPAVYLNLTHIASQRGNYEELIVYADKTSKVSSDFKAKFPSRGEYYQLNKAQAHINKGLALLALGRYSQAESELLFARTLAEALGSQEIMARANVNLARMSNILGHLFKGLHLLHDASRQFRNAGISIDQATVSLEEAMLYGRLMIHTRARSSALLAAEAFDKAGLRIESLEARLMAIETSLALQEPTKAQNYYKQAERFLGSKSSTISLLLQAYGLHPQLFIHEKYNRRHLAIIEQLTERLLAQGALRESLIVRQICARILIEFDDAARAATMLHDLIDSAHKAHLPYLERESASLLATLQKPEEAIHMLRRAADILANERLNIPTEELKAQMLSGHGAIFNRLIEAYLNGGQIADATQTIIEAKGALWADLRGTHIPQTTDPGWAKAKFELAYWREELLWGGDKAYTKLCEAKIREAEETIVNAARRQQRYRQPNPIPLLNQVQEQLNAKAVALEYLVSEHQIWICVIARNEEPEWFEVGDPAIAKDALARLSLLLATLQFADSEGVRLQAAMAQKPILNQLLHQLYLALIAPIVPSLHDATQLIIAPHEYLFEVPWSALFDSKRYLCEMIQLTTVPSSAVLGLPTSEQECRADNRVPTVLALGHEGSRPLNHLEAELSAIQRAFPTAMIVHPAGSDDLATETGPEILHIAAHGVIDRETPLFSQLDLADGPFLLADVFNLDLSHTQSVVLSCCNTGTTPEHGGVLLALAGAFLTAGADMVLTTLWAVDDEATQIFMGKLYESLAQGIPVSEALSAIQRSFIGDKYSHPFYWAPFQLLSKV